MENICSYQKLLTYKEDSVPNKGYSTKQAHFLCTLKVFLYVSLSSSTVCQPNFFPYSYTFMIMQLYIFIKYLIYFFQFLVFHVCLK